MGTLNFALLDKPFWLPWILFLPRRSLFKSKLSFEFQVPIQHQKWQTGRADFAGASTTVAFASSPSSFLATLLARMPRLLVKAALCAAWRLSLVFRWSSSVLCTDKDSGSSRASMVLSWAT